MRHGHRWPAHQDGRRISLLLAQGDEIQRPVLHAQGLESADLLQVCAVVLGKCAGGAVSCDTPEVPARGRGGGRIPQSMAWRSSSFPIAGSIAAAVAASVASNALRAQSTIRRERGMMIRLPSCQVGGLIATLRHGSVLRRALLGTPVRGHTVRLPDIRHPVSSVRQAWQQRRRRRRGDLQSGADARTCVSCRSRAWSSNAN